MPGAALLNSGQAAIRGGAYPNNPVGGGGGGRVYVEELPPIDEANQNAIYIRTTDWTQWTPRGTEVVPASPATPASLTAKDFEHSDLRDPASQYVTYRGVVNNADPITPVQGNYWYDRGGGVWQFAQSGGSAVTPSTLIFLFSSGAEISGGVENSDLWVNGGYLNSQQAANYDDAASFLSWIDPPRSLNLRNLVDYFDDGWKFYYYDEALDKVRTVSGYNEAAEAMPEHEIDAWQSIGGGGGGGGGGPHSHSLSGRSVQTLFDNTADTADALARIAGNPAWSSVIDAPLGLSLVAAHDTRQLHVAFIYTQEGQVRSFDFMMDAGTFRNFDAVNTDDTTTSGPSHVHPFAIVDGRDGRGDLTNSFGRIGFLIRGTDADGDVARIALNVVNNSVGAISDMRGVIALVPRVDALSVGTAGAVVTTPLQGNALQVRDNFPVAADFLLGDIINVLGYLYERGTITHEGGPKDGGFLTVTDANFRGFHRQTNSISNFVTGNFYYSLNDNIFHRRESTGGVISVLPYDPFAEGEPWAPYTYRGHVNTDAEALAAATEIGEAWAVIGLHRIRRLDTFTPAGQLYESPAWKGYRESVGGNPVAYFWVDGSSERVDLDFPYTQDDLNSVLRIRFADATPNEVFDGWPHGSILVASPATLDNVGAPAIGTDRVSFQPPAGRFKMTVYLQSLDPSGQIASLRLMKVATGTDDTELIRTPGFAGIGGTVVLPTVGAGYILDYPDFVTDGTGVYYLRLSTLHADFDGSGILGYLRLEQLPT